MLSTTHRVLACVALAAFLAAPLLAHAQWQMQDSHATTSRVPHSIRCLD